MINIPRIQLFSDILEYDQWKLIYDKENGSGFEFVGYGSPVRWEENAHSEDPDFKFNKSYLASEDDISGKRHGDLYKVSMETDIKQSVINSILTNMLDDVHLYIEKSENKKLIRESGPWITKMSKGDYMSMHCDGTFILNKNNVAEYSIIYYINDDYTGGEFNMPKMGFKLKPKANSILLFSNSFNENMAHEVTEVISGDRYISQSWYSTML